MLRIAVVVGSTRPGRKAPAVARWVHETASKRGDAEYEVVDVQDYGLPLLDEPQPGRASKPHALAWSAKVASFDAYAFVSPEYNHGTSAALKNALDFLYKEWNDKAAGFVAYGGVGGVRAVEQLRLNAAELQLATVRNQVILTLREDFKDYEAFAPRPFQAKALGAMLDQLLAWGGALKTVREGRAAT